MTGLTRCNACRFWDGGVVEGLCRRRAPTTSDRPLDVARWPETRAADGCGDGEASGSGAQGQACGTCVFWDRPGHGIDPPRRGDRMAAWWNEAGFCRRHAPVPGAEIGTHAFWRATHAADRCFEGEAG